MIIEIVAVVDGEQIKLNDDLNKVVTEIVEHYVKQKLSEGFFKSKKMSAYKLKKQGLISHRKPSGNKRPVMVWTSQDVAKLIEGVKSQRVLHPGAGIGALGQKLYAQFPPRSFFSVRGKIEELKRKKLI